MYVCICNAVTDRDILKAIDDGVSTVEGLGDTLNVGTCCGRCKSCAEGLIQSTRMKTGFDSDLYQLAVGA
jgi:bacterioferritin-associated ferredoxin